MRAYCKASKGRAGCGRRMFRMAASASTRWQICDTAAHTISGGISKEHKSYGNMNKLVE